MFSTDLWWLVPPLFRDSPGSPILTTTGQSACESAGPQAGDVRENNAPPAGTAGILEQQWSQNLPAHQMMNANLIQSRFQSKRACGMVEMTRCRGTESSTSPMICLCPNGPSKRSCLPKHILSARHLLRRAPTAIFAVKQRRILVFIFLFLVNFREPLTSSKPQEMFIYIYKLYYKYIYRTETVPFSSTIAG